MTEVWGPVLAAACGAVLWTFIEYWLHRTYGHRKGRNWFTVEHLAHHADTAYFAPTWKKMVAVGVAYVAIGIPLWLTTGLVGAAGLAGFLLMYLTYEFVHRRLHTHPPLTRYGRWARRHHYYHHFKRPQLNQGVTSPVWDWVFGTLEVPSVVGVPKKHQQPWMTGSDGQMPAYLEAPSLK